MNRQSKYKITLFFSSLLLVLQLVNALHFVFIDHTVSKETGIKAIDHQCDDYILYPNFTTTLPSITINPPVWNDVYCIEEILYTEQYQFVYNTIINNKGPPFVERNKA